MAELAPIFSGPLVFSEFSSPLSLKLETKSDSFRKKKKEESSLLSSTFHSKFGAVFFGFLG